MQFVRLLLACASLTSSFPANGHEPKTTAWSQFRGQNASGISENPKPLPIEFGPEKNVAWKTAVTHGLSSPCISAERVFLTSFEPKSKTLELSAIDRTNGDILWRRPVEAKGIEKVHKVSSPASGTCVADDNRVYAYFGSCGVVCFDFDGKPLWKHEMPVAERFNGSGTSPILVGETLIVNREDDRERYLLALNRKTGDVAWKYHHLAHFGLFGGASPTFGEATPVIWNDQIILHRQNTVSGHSIKDGSALWSFGLQTTGCSTPVIADGILYVSAWNNFGETSLKPSPPPFDRVVRNRDKNGDEQISFSELPGNVAIVERPELDPGLGGNIPLKFFFTKVDTNRDGKLNAQEWDAISDVAARLIKTQQHGLVALALTGETPEVTWRENNSIAEVPSPLYLDGRVYMVKNGGILSCFDAKSGKRHYRKRLGVPGPWYASLIAADGRIYGASDSGTVVVITPGDEFGVLAKNVLGETIMATPAVIEDTIYVRTAKHLFAFTKR